MTFTNEADFEAALVSELQRHGWNGGVIHNPDEKALLKNWADILLKNNRGIDRLNDVPLTDTEIAQIVEQINELKKPMRLNGFINGKTVAIRRDNPQDALHMGKEVSLKIFDRQEIAAGQSCYQIAVQPRFAARSEILGTRRGDVMLLINGMPVIHIELKRSGVPVSHAYHQIERYSKEGVFAGIFALVQVFVAMTPEEMRYFSNPGEGGKFNPDFYFQWADFNNQAINDWQRISARLLSIPMAHQLIGFYTVADNFDGALKVMRSYQYYAADAISRQVANNNWQDNNQLGGYIWHTTGSGKTMTSFKSAQLIAQSQDADKVVFLVDRIELGTQSLEAYRGFAADDEAVQATEDTNVLMTKLKSNNPADTLIVSSIQKMSNISAEVDNARISLQRDDITKIKQKRLVFVLDEAHRSVFGGDGETDGMMTRIKKTFPSALFFGFTGTPVLAEIPHHGITTADIFGNELHRYSIADGIRDKNVLGFDPYKVLTFKDADLRRAVALREAKASTVEEALADPEKKKVYNRFMRMEMAGKKVAGKQGKSEYIKGIEDYIPPTQYQTDSHRQAVVQDIMENWLYGSQNGKFHAIFATSSIAEAIEYYRLIKKECSWLKITALFDPNINEGSDPADSQFKQDGLVEIIEDYNVRYDKNYRLANHAAYKKDLGWRLAHKKIYKKVEQEKHQDQRLDMLIVVDQMLTGFDSKWVNTLHLDKLMKNQHIIQAFSRTNRLYEENEKPFGIIRYYRYPHTMERNITAAVDLYAGYEPYGLFVDKLPDNLTSMNHCYEEIAQLFKNAEVENFCRLPEAEAACGQFVKLFNQFNRHLEAAKAQGFQWSKTEYTFNTGKEETIITLALDENIYKTLLQRYKELSAKVGEGSGSEDALPFDIRPYVTVIDTTEIDTAYMNFLFERYMQANKVKQQQQQQEPQQQTISAEVLQALRGELEKIFARFGEEKQKIARSVFEGIKNGTIAYDASKPFSAYIDESIEQEEDEKINRLVATLSKVGKEEQFRKQLRTMRQSATEDNINEFGRFDILKDYVDREKAKAFFEQGDGEKISLFATNAKIDKYLRAFILKTSKQEA